MAAMMMEKVSIKKVRQITVRNWSNEDVGQFQRKGEDIGDHPAEEEVVPGDEGDCQ